MAYLQAQIIRPATYLQLATVFGLLAGCLEVIYHLAEKALGWRWYTRVSPDFVWMTPVTHGLLFLVLGGCFIGLNRLLPRRIWLILALFTFSYLLFVNLFLVHGKMDGLAMVLLAVGLATQTTRLLRRRWVRIEPLLGRCLLWLILLIGASTAATMVSRWLVYREAMARVPSSAPGAANVILITLDTVRAQNLSLYGYGRRTSPQLEKWAQKGVWFQKALVPAPWTLPSHASMFTGHYPHELTAHWRTPLDDTHATLAEVLRDQGYLTAGFVANRYYAGYDSGLARGFVQYEDYDHSPGEFINCSALTRWLFYNSMVRQVLGFYDRYGRKNAAEVNAAFLSWQERRHHRPFFAFLNYFDAHDPYLAPAPYDGEFGPPPTFEDKRRLSEWWSSPPADLPQERIEAAIRGYDGAIAYMDQQLDNLFQELQRRNLLANTLVVITSDHGEHFGEHQRFIHGNSLHRQLLHVPLVMFFPGRIAEGTSVKEFVTLRDLPATVMALVAKDSKPAFPGHTLSRFWDPEYRSAPESPLFQVAFAIPGHYARPDHGRSPVATDWILSLFHDGKHYIRYGVNGEEEIFDFDGDLNDQHNLAESPQHAALLQGFRTKVTNFLAEQPGVYVDFPPSANALAGLPKRFDLQALFACGRCREE